MLHNALEIAVHSNQLPIVHLFVVCGGVDVHFFHESYLRLACKLRHMEMIRLLISLGADMHCTSHYFKENHPLDYATDRNDTVMMEFISGLLSK
jgi:hypothetical protein